MSLLRKTKQKYFEKLYEKDVTDSKNFWKVMKSSFSNKAFGEVTLVESGNIVKDHHEIAELFNNFFGNIVKNLQLPLPPSETVQDIERVSVLSSLCCLVASQYL